MSDVNGVRSGAHVFETEKALWSSFRELLAVDDDAGTGNTFPSFGVRHTASYAKTANLRKRKVNSTSLSLK